MSSTSNLAPAYVKVDAGIVSTNDVLGPNKLSKVRLNSGLAIGKYAYRLGLSERLTSQLTHFLEESGIRDTFRVLLTQNSLEPGEHLSLPLNMNNSKNSEHLWNIQRPRSHWSNNMHWIAPANTNAQNAYLETLKRGGFDFALESIAKQFGMKKDEIIIHHAFFIGVSKATSSFVHQDNPDSGGRGFTVLIPLRLVEYSGSELAFQTDNRENEAWYKYRMNEAVLVGDGTWHKTADCDYQEMNEYRICANIYVCHKGHPINNATNAKGVVS